MTFQYEFATDGIGRGQWIVFIVRRGQRWIWAFAATEERIAELTDEANGRRRK